MNGSEEPARSRSPLGRAWSRAITIGDHLGKLATLVTFPSVLVAFFVFWQELIDLASAPDFDASIDTVEVRCAVALGSAAAIEAAREDFATACGSAPLAISTEITLTNEDTISRTLESLSLRVSVPAVPGLENPVELSLVRHAEHQIVNHVESVVLLPWQTLTFSPGQTRIVEVQFEPLHEEHRRDFATFRDAAARSGSELTDTTARIELRTRVPGSNASATLLACEVPFDAGSLTRFAERSGPERVAYTRRCLSARDA